MLLMKNLWFSALPPALRRGLKAYLTMVEVKKGDSIAIGQKGGAIFFPINCVAILSARSGNGPKSFLRFSGSSFLIGLTDMLSIGSILFEAEICGDGYGFSLPKSTILSCLPSSAEFNALQLRIMSHIAEKGLISTHCLGTHTGVQRLARILLEAADAFGDGRSITLTQQELSEMLMLRRETVSQLLVDWKTRDIVSLRRGRLSIRNKAELMMYACNCHSVIKPFENEELALWGGMSWTPPLTAFKYP